MLTGTGKDSPWLARERVSWEVAWCYTVGTQTRELREADNSLLMWSLTEWWYTYTASTFTRRYQDTLTPSVDHSSGVIVLSHSHTPQLNSYIIIMGFWLPRNYNESLLVELCNLLSKPLSYDIILLIIIWDMMIWWWCMWLLISIDPQYNSFRTAHR